jgi:hypothetical protein
LYATDFSTDDDARGDRSLADSLCSTGVEMYSKQEMTPPNLPQVGGGQPTEPIFKEWGNGRTFAILLGMAKVELELDA